MTHDLPIGALVALNYPGHVLHGAVLEVQSGHDGSAEASVLCGTPMVAVRTVKSRVVGDFWFPAFRLARLSLKRDNAIASSMFPADST